MSFAPDCSEKARLISELKDSINDLMTIHNQQVEALIRGELESVSGHEERLLEARRRKNEVLAALKAHMEEHHC